jgi:hypothetical protein
MPDGSYYIGDFVNGNQLSHNKVGKKEGASYIWRMDQTIMVNSRII